MKQAIVISFFVTLAPPVWNNMPASDKKSQDIHI